MIKCCKYGIRVMHITGGMTRTYVHVHSARPGRARSGCRGIGIAIRTPNHVRVRAELGTPEHMPRTSCCGLASFPVCYTESDDGRPSTLRLRLWVRRLVPLTHRLRVIGSAYRGRPRRRRRPPPGTLHDAWPHHNAAAKVFPQAGSHYCPCHSQRACGLIPVLLPGPSQRG